MEFLDSVKDSKKSHFLRMRKLTIMQVLDIIENIQPIDIQKLKSHIEFQTGISSKKSEEILRILFDVEKINIDEKNIITVKGGSK